MSELDGTDREILRLLMEDARRPYKEIGDEVGLSPPAISDRIARLEELGVIRRFTLDVDRSRLAEGDSVHVELRAAPGRAEEVVAGLRGAAPIEHVVRTVDDRVFVRTYMSEAELRELVIGTLDPDIVREFDVRGVVESAWNPAIGEGDLVVECVECGNPIEGESVSVTLDGDRYHLCCPSCESLFVEKYERLEEGAEEA